MTPLAVLACAVAVADWGPIRVDADGVPLPPGVLARIGSTRFRHTGRCTHVFLSGDRVLGVTADGDLYTWDATSGRRLRTDFLAADVEQAALRADGKLVFAVRTGRGGQGELRTLGMTAADRTARTLLSFDDEGCGLSADGSLFARRTGGLVQFFDTRTARQVAETRLSIAAYQPHLLLFSPDNKRLAAVFRQWVEVREVATGNIVYSAGAPRDEEFLEAAFSPDGRQLVQAVSADTEHLDIVDLTAEKTTRVFERRGSMTAPAFSADGRAVYVVATNRVVRVDRATKAVTTFNDLDRRVAWARPFDGGRQLALGGWTGQLAFCDPVTGQRLSATPPDVETDYRRMAFSNDGKQLLLDDTAQQSAQFVDVAAGRVRRTLRTADEEWVATLPDGRRYARGTPAGVQLRDAATDAVTFEAAKALAGRATIRTAADGRLLFADGLKLVESWDVVANTRLAPSSAVDLDFLPSPDGEYAMAAHRSRSSLWRLELLSMGTRNPVPGWPTVHAYSRDVQFAASGRLALFETTGLVARLLELPAARVRRLQVPISGWSVGQGSISRDERSVALWYTPADGPPAVGVWEASSGKLRIAFDADGYATATAFSSDNRTLAVLTPTAPLYLFDLRGTLLDLPKRLDRVSVDLLWDQLRGDDARMAFHALRCLAAAPGSAIPFLRRAVPPAVRPPAERVAALVRSLEAPSFQDREAAAKELVKLADLIEGELRAAEQETPSPEVQQRLEKVLTTLLPDSPNSVVRSRIVEVVEWCGTADAKQLLREWAAGAGGASLTKEAKAALARLGG